jgi:hypothetical protein
MKKPLLLAFRRGLPGILRPTSFYPVGPLVSRLSAHAKKALFGFKAFGASVGVKERITSMRISGYSCGASE